VGAYILFLVLAVSLALTVYFSFKNGEAVLQFIELFLGIFGILSLAVLIFSYYGNRPIIEYEINRAARKCSKNGCEYRFILTLFPAKSRVKINNAYVTTPSGVFPSGEILSSIDPNPEYTFAKELDFKTKRLHSKGKKGIEVYLLTEKIGDELDLRKEITPRFILEVENDPIDHGILSVLHQASQYTLVAEAKIDFEASRPLRGKFAPYTKR
jgi:hypothetical protein